MFAKTKKAFTIVELVIVIAVIAILMGIMFVGGSAISNNAKEATLESDMRSFETNIKTAINLNASDVHRDTTQDKWMETLNIYFEDDMTLSKAATGTGGVLVPTDDKECYQYVTTMLDPYGKPYVVTITNKSSAANTYWDVVVQSFGKNKQTTAAGAGLDADDCGLLLTIKDSEISTAEILPVDGARADTNNVWANITVANVNTAATP